MSRLDSAPAFHRQKHRHPLSHSLRPDPSPFSSHGAEIMCSHRARMAAAMWEQIRANKGWKLCIPDTSISPTIKREGVKTSWAMSSSSCPDSEKAEPPSKLSACRSTEPCRPSAARRAYRSSGKLVQSSVQPCEHNMCNGPAVRREGAQWMEVWGGKDFRLRAFCYCLELTARTRAHTHALSHTRTPSPLDTRLNSSARQILCGYGVFVRKH